jgi:alpha-N-arabinofuranosidase
MDIQQVAKRAKVSTATVSRVLNGSSSVRDATSAHVRKVIAELDYVPNSHARSLRAGRTRMFGLIVSDINNPFFPELIDAFEALASQHGIDVIFTHTNYDPKRLRSCIRRMVERGVDGIAVMTSEVAFSQALKPVSKDVLLMATGDSPNGFEKWNAAQLTNPPGTFDLLTMHFITGTNHVRLNPYAPDFMAAAAYAVPYALGPDLDKMQAQMDAVPGYKGTHFAVTEWLFNSKGDGERNFTNESPSSRNEGGAVMIASTFNTFFRHNDEVKLVDMTGLMEFAGIWKRREQVFASPAYYAFQLYSAAKGATVLPVTTDSGSYSVKNGTQGYSDVADVPYIDIVATLSPDKRGLTLFCINRSLTDDAPTEIDLGAFSAKTQAKVEQITAVSRYVMNDEIEPRRVVPQVSSVNIRPKKPVSITLPHESVTVILMQAK